MKLISRALIPSAALAAMAVLGAPANATLVAQETFQLTSDHCSGGGCLGGASSAGVVTVSQNQDAAEDNTLTFNVTLNSGFKFVSTGFDTDFGFSLNGNPTITYTSITSGFEATGGSPQSAGALKMDGAGTFEYGVTCTACGNGGSNPQSGPLTFTIDAATDLTLASLQTEQPGTGAPNYFAVDVLGNGNTGAVDASVGTIVNCQTGLVCGTQEVPEPASLALLGSALLGFASIPLIRRRREV